MLINEAKKLSKAKVGDIKKNKYDFYKMYTNTKNFFHLSKDGYAIFAYNIENLNEKGKAYAFHGFVSDLLKKTEEGYIIWTKKAWDK
jgi:hypothetical protein